MAPDCSRSCIRCNREKEGAWEAGGGEEPVYPDFIVDSENENAHPTLASALEAIRRDDAELKERIKKAMKLPGQSILIDPEDLNEEFFPGKAGIGFVTPFGGLFFTADWDDPEPGFLLVIGPFYLWGRRYWGTHAGLYRDFR